MLNHVYLDFCFLKTERVWKLRIPIEYYNYRSNDNRIIDLIIFLINVYFKKFKLCGLLNNKFLARFMLIYVDQEKSQI